MEKFEHPSVLGSSRGKEVGKGELELLSQKLRRQVTKVGCPACTVPVASIALRDRN